MNPLTLPWSKKAPPTPEAAPVPSFIGTRNETQRDFFSTRAEQFITVTVHGVKGTPDGEYKLPWVDGNALKLYLKQVNLTMAAIKSAVRDKANPECGRVRMTYIPQPGAHITLGNSSVSSALEFQRSNHNAERVAAGMGNGAREVEVKIVR